MKKEQTKLAGKKSRWWLWIIIALVVIGAGIVIYLLLSSGADLSGVGGRILTPPALPS